ncbi:hypothetical protein [Streptomyces aidingensis]|uniref:Uncharacterized protein n=1 Tax=Streptomyces aidingensis TaxID=910347 RepID=A0A1I1GWS1_9ACTN|nr:hypothetical protein [Streptomyces aidingensis]SFC13623.1 hypothetical protein SAMN05421773_10286 [Streptomyces aidingensis]
MAGAQEPERVTPERVTPELEALERAVERAAGRLRRLPESALRRGAAAGGRALAAELARRAQRLEGRPAGLPPLPDAGIFAVGDQLAVTGHDLIEAVRALGPGEAAAREAGQALALLREAAS